MGKTIIEKDIADSIKSKLGIKSAGQASIREIKKLADEIESASGVKFVRMEMGVDDMGDAHAFVAGDIQIVLNVAFGVDHDHASGLRAADAVGKTSESWCYNLLKVHESSVLWIDGNTLSGMRTGFSGSGSRSLRAWEYTSASGFWLMAAAT